MKLTLARLRGLAISASLGQPTTLRRAIARLGFVQADPIRAPARAQDLILRHRVKDYRAGDLEAKYASLGIEEDFLYAYGFMPQETWALLHPRPEEELTSAEQKVLEIVRMDGKVHPREFEKHLGRERKLNGWGGFSKTTTQALQGLHYRGLLRVAGREKGIRLYELAEREQVFQNADERLRKLILVIARILAPIAVRSLETTLLHEGRAALRLTGRRSAITRMIASGDLACEDVQSVRYVWPADWAVSGRADQKVRFLAPFDPIVWNRKRFEHFWGWAYRFEAYTPPAKRIRGYYAMPMLWGDRVIGWVNASNRGGSLEVEAGFEGGRPRDAGFREEFQAEVERFRQFLAIRSESNGRE